jgi:hypothetical protein
MSRHKPKIGKIRTRKRGETAMDLSSQNETLQSNTRETQVNLSGIAPGTYSVRVDCGDEVFYEKLVVTRYFVTWFHVDRINP